MTLSNYLFVNLSNIYLSKDYKTEEAEGCVCGGGREGDEDIEKSIT